MRESNFVLFILQVYEYEEKVQDLSMALEETAIKRAFPYTGSAVSTLYRHHANKGMKKATPRRKRLFHFVIYTHLLVYYIRIIST
jgi:hypothetical protein